MVSGGGKLTVSQRGAAAEQIAPATARAALYVRVSTAKQAEKWSPAAQRQHLWALAERKGWDAELYDEGAASAETIDGRPVMRQLLKDVASGRFDIVAVIEMERLCRASDLRDWATITTTLRRAGVLVATPERTFNLDTAEDDFEADLRGILSKREKRKLLERTKRGVDQAKDAGKFAGGHAPFGYRYDVATKKVVVEEDKVPLVHRIFESDLSSWHLAKELRSEGIDLNYTLIDRIRGLPFYLGLRPDSKGKLIKADWPAIVTKDLWDKQARRPPSIVRRTCRPRKSAYLLSAIARCANCGGPMVGTKDQRKSKSHIPRYHYRCAYYTKCPTGGGKISGWLVDAVVTETLHDYARDPERLRKRFSRALDGLEGGLVAERRAQLDRKVRALEERQERLLDAVERGVVDDQTAKKRLRENAASIRKLTNELEVLHATEYVPSLPDFQLILDLAKDIRNASKEDRRKLLDRLATGVVIDPRGRTVTITWRLGGETQAALPDLRVVPFPAKYQRYARRAADGSGA